MSNLLVCSSICAFDAGRVLIVQMKALTILVGCELSILITDSGRGSDEHSI